MYCGSCLRDNAMATELIARGHDVMLLPVYTPTLTDEPNVSNDHVALGGISAYLEQYDPIFRKTPRWLDRHLGFKNCFESCVTTIDLDESADAWRDDRFGVERRKRISAQRDRQADRVAQCSGYA